METDAGIGATTLTLSEPDTAPVVAVMVAAPTATPEARPVVDTATVPASEVAHVAVTPGKTAPWPSFTVAISCRFWPTTTVAGDGPIDMEAGLESGPAASPQARAKESPPASTSAAIRTCDPDETLGP
jgi:hypothetical protein